jgi:outer membrane PBP1 activator LpoA protein
MKLQRTVLPVIAALLLAACGTKPAESSLAELLAWFGAY